MDKVTILVGDCSYEIEIIGKQIRVNGREVDFEILESLKGSYSLKTGGRTYQTFLKNSAETSYDVWIGSKVVPVQVKDAREELLSRFKSTTQSGHAVRVIKAPMPGLVVQIEVKPGDTVKVGQGLVILEAMKMENEIRSPIEGIVKSVEVSKKMKVEKDQKLLVLEAT